jgi:hypothetical protein
MIGSQCLYQNASEVARDLETLILSDQHIKPYTNAVLDAKLSTLAKKAYDSIYKGNQPNPEEKAILNFGSVEAEVRSVLQESIQKGAWREDCKGRDLLKAYCAKNGLRYEHFRNILISRLKTPPQALSAIMEKILS